VLTNITKKLHLTSFFDDKITPLNETDHVPEQNSTFLVGTTGSQNVEHTANTTQHAATAIWHFAQTWFEECVPLKFSLYSPRSDV